MIPKIIHYCWFGKNPKPNIVLKCMNSWKKNLPNYRFIEWNEKNYNINRAPIFIREAYNSRKYAFITDYMRLRALSMCGGIYLDCDVEILKPLDCFLEHKAFTGHETKDLMVTAVMGAEKNHPWINYLLEYYEDARFDMTPNTKIITEMSIPLVEKYESGFRHLKDDVVIYPVETFCPYDHKRLVATPTKDSYAIHHFAGTWIGRTQI